MVARNQSIESFSGALVFPGGKLHTSDQLPEANAYCRISAGVDEAQLAFRITAIREAFEESGVLLARCRATGNPIDKVRMTALGIYRNQLAAGEIELLEVAQRENLELATDLLLHFSNLVTPPGVSKQRFDTHFYVAVMPMDYQLLHDGSETVSSLWENPAVLLAAAEQGTQTILFPTRVNLSKIAIFSSTDSLLNACKTASVVKITPEIRQMGDHALLYIAESEGFPFHQLPIRLARPKTRQG